MSKPLRDRKTCLPTTRKRLIKRFQQALKVGYDETTAKRVAMYAENRYQQDGKYNFERSGIPEALKRKSLTGGKEKSEDFDRLTNPI